MNVFHYWFLLFSNAFEIIGWCYNFRTLKTLTSSLSYNTLQMLKVKIIQAQDVKYFN